MLKEYADIFRRVLIITDCALMGSAFFLAYFACRHMDRFFLSGIYFLSAYLWILPLSMALWGWFLYALRMYNAFRLKKTGEIISIIVRSAFLSFVIFSVIAYVCNIEHISRLFVGLFFVVTLLLLILEKVSLILFFRRLHARGFNFRNVLVVGTGARARNFVRYLDQDKELGLKVIGLVDEDPMRTGAVIQGHEVLGDLSDIPEILRRQVVDYAVFIVPRSSLGKIEPGLRQCEMVGVTASVAVDLFNLKFAMIKETDMMGIPMITFEVGPHNIVDLLIKRLCDIVISSAALALISPLYLAVAISIKLTSPGPVYFVQERCGLSGRKFKLYKFRTMVQGAESRLKDLLSHNEMSGPVFKMENDPRITTIGKSLRKYSLDELPQLWNVFHGDMSLVGPRPPLPSEVQQYDPWHQRRLSIRPGITCIWQASGRNRISNFDQWVTMDLEYIDHWSLWLDFKILFKTLPAVLSASGAK
ncbi:MAG: sugar transferase [Candidatus Omnitrophica bacterium]|nr:sugar transferase [Candidatus Omnitrophota bacterium]